MDYNKNTVESKGSVSDQNSATIITNNSGPETNIKEPPRDLTKQRYGWGRFRPGFLQFLNQPKWFLIIVAGLTIFQGMSVLGLQSIVLPTIERRYHFSGKELGVISSANDVSALIFVIFISYYGDYANKPKWIGYGAILTGIGVLLFALPHAIVEKYEPVGTRTSILCQPSTTNTTTSPQCHKLSGGEWYYLLTFVIAQLVIGVGNSPFYSLVFPYLDEIVEPRSISTYFGVLNFVIFMGPGLGYLVGGQFLSIYVDIIQPVGVKLSPRSPTWIGAWWLGFVVFGTIIIFFALFLLGFPAQMPGVKERREEHIRKGNLKRPQSKISTGIKEFFPELKKLVTNWTFLFSSLSFTVAMFYSAALSFLSKLIRDKFGLDPVTIGYALSAVAIIAVLLGNLVGSFVVRLFSLKGICKKSALLCAVIYFISAPSPTMFLIPGCDNVNLAGVTRTYDSHSHTDKTSLNLAVRTPTNQSSSMRLASHCNKNCGCSLNRFFPVCGSNSVTYVNPCYAGCKKMLRNKTFVNCTCIHGLPHNSNPPPGTATPGYCNRNCKNAIIFLVLCAVVITMRATIAVPMKIVTLRCVADDKRAFANGMHYFMLKAFALLPAPILFGHLLDTSCRLWGSGCGGAKGRCFDYDLEKLSRVICTYGSCVLALSAILFSLAWYFCKTDDITCETTVKARENYGMDDVQRESSTKM